MTISNMAKLLAVHPQTLRLYERHGLITPSRTRGNTRLYSQHDVEQIRTILHLTRHLGVNLAGVEIVLHMQRKPTPNVRLMICTSSWAHNTTSPRRGFRNVPRESLVMNLSRCHDGTEHARHHFTLPYLAPAQADIVRH
jgi:DNA-binding transcriptional MerR regulator